MHVAAVLELRIVIMRIPDDLLGLRHEIGEAARDVVEVAAALVPVHDLAGSGPAAEFTDGDKLGLLLDRIDLAEAALQFLDRDLRAHVLRLIIVQLILNAHPVESVVAREHVEFFFEDGLEAEVAGLRRTDRNRLVLHLSLLVSQNLRILRQIVQICLQRFNFDFVIAEAIAEVVFHVLYFLVRWKQGQEVVDLQLRIVENFQGFINWVLLHLRPVVIIFRIFLIIVV